jgi:DNA-binding response OmpR family regulator
MSKQRRLLLADDSVTVQKVVSLTFTDEGMEVITVSSGEEALRRLEEVIPDVILLDSALPGINGFKVCEQIKADKRLSSVPVMLLVGMFEPFDETEARRVGADDVLTKPFQSIRNLVNKVGSLLGRRQEEPPVTGGLLGLGVNRSEDDYTESDYMETPEAGQHAERSRAGAAASGYGSTIEDRGMESSRYNETSQTKGSIYQSGSVTESQRSYRGAVSDEDSLLDLGEIEPIGGAAEADDFILDLTGDLPSPPLAVREQHTQPTQRATEERPSVESYMNSANMTSDVDFDDVEVRSYEAESDLSYSRNNVNHVSEIDYEEYREEPEVTKPGYTESQSSRQQAQSISGTDQLSAEAIDAIARRVVELISDKVVREVAWEVVPELAERLIKQQLEEEKKKNR